MNTRLTGPKVTIMRFRRLLAHGLLLLGTLTLLFPTACRTHSPVRVELSTIDGAIGLKTPVRTLVDREGIPHVYAANREDAAFVLGWFHARDRFLQMDIYRRAGLGRLAEILGPSVVEEDREARTIGLHTSADLAWQVLADDSLEAGIIRSYTKGVNRFLEHASPSELPAFYGENDLVPEPWSEVDCFAVYKKFTAELCFSVDDLLLQLVAEGLGREAADALFPVERDARSPAVRHPIKADEISNLRLGGVPRSLNSPDTRDRMRSGGQESSLLASRADSERLELSEECVEILKRRGSLSNRMVSKSALASNAWAISGNRSRNSRPILCVDSHMGFSQPTLFYTAHLSSPGLGVLGATVPGMPAVLLGHNGFFSWAFSNSQSDVTDFFVETFNPEDPGRYLYRGNWRPVQETEERIRVRGEDDVVFKVRRTHHGPILNELGKGIAVKWWGEVPSSDLVSFLRINSARNLQQFVDALRQYVSPILNFLYADRLGSIAVRTSGWVPRRLNGLGRYPVDGSRGEYEWRVAPVPFEEMPLSVNPPEGYLLAANQRLLSPDSSCPYYFGWQFAPSFRARRIEELLSSSEHLTVRDMVRFQFDNVDLLFRDLIPLLLESFEEWPDEPNARLALRFLQGWNGRVEPHRVEPTIAWEWLEHFNNAVWADEWDRAGLSRQSRGEFSSGGWQPPLDVLVELSLSDPESEWFDNVETVEREDRATVMRQSFLKAVDELTADLGPGMNSWTWGSRNRMVIPDLLKDPKRAQSVEAVPGNRNTVIPGGAGGAVTEGSVYRMVVPLGDVQRARGASPGVQSGVPAGENADQIHERQLRAYLSGDYVPLNYYPFFGDFPADDVSQILAFHPKDKRPLDERFPTPYGNQ